MFIGPPLAGIAGMARSYIAGFARLCGALPTAMDGGNAGLLASLALRASLRLLLPLVVVQEQKPALHPSARGGIPLRTPLARVPA